MFIAKLKLKHSLTLPINIKRYIILLSKQILIMAFSNYNQITK